MVIPRQLTTVLRSAAKQLPVVALMGPRQSGKTTLARLTFNQHVYISLEDLDKRAQATQDPREFLEFHKNPHGLILDEIQNAPSILSYIQTQVDQDNIPGYFILTGSEYFLINQAITQTLAGRIAILTLLPLSIAELEAHALLPQTIEEVIYKGFYVKLYSHAVSPTLWYPSYILTYIERDVRQVTTIGDLTTFKLFMQLCAGRIGQLLNVSSLANDCGINLRTAETWLSLLQASYIIFLLQPYYKNFSKRVVKTPKLYFYDTGLACSLLNIESVEQVRTHYLRGGLVESLLVSDLLKQYYDTSRMPNLYFWRDNHGNEVDCILEKGTHLFPIEIKAGRTVVDDYFVGLEHFKALAQSAVTQSFVLYAGTENQKRSRGVVLSWQSAANLIDAIYET